MYNPVKHHNKQLRPQRMDGEILQPKKNACKWIVSASARSARQSKQKRERAEICGTFPIDLETTKVVSKQEEAEEDSADEADSEAEETGDRCRRGSWRSKKTKARSKKSRTMTLSHRMIRT